MNYQSLILIKFLLQIKKGKFIIIIIFNQLLKTLPDGAIGQRNISIPDKIQISKSLKYFLPLSFNIKC